MALNSTLLSTLARALRFSGRAALSEFWFFMPVGAVICVISATVAGYLDFTFMGIVLLVAVASCPLLAVWWRRLQDVGVWGAHALFPAISLFVFLFTGTAALTLISDGPPSLSDGGPIMKHPDSVVFLFFIFPELLFKFFLGKWVALLIAFISLIAFLFRFTFAFSQALLPSQPGPNRYGPNPHEVPQ